MAGLRDLRRFKQAGRSYERPLNTRVEGHIHYLSLLSAFLGLGVGS